MAGVKDVVDVKDAVVVVVAVVVNIVVLVVVLDAEVEAAARDHRLLLRSGSG